MLLHIDSASKLIANASKLLSDLSKEFTSADDLLAKREKISRYTTGSVKFDTFLNVGFETQAITEIAGEYGSTSSPHSSSSKKLQVFVEGINNASYHESQTSIGRKA